MKNLWTFGCSFTGEYYPVDLENMRTNYDDYKDWRGGNLPPVWPTNLANKLGFKCNNLGRGAMSNSSIFNTFCKVSHKISKGDVVIIGWTSMLRSVLVKPDTNELIDILINQEYGEFDKNYLDYYFVNRSLTGWIDEIIGYVNLISEYVKTREANIYFWTSDHTILDYIKKNYDRYNDNDFLYWRGSNENLDLMHYVCSAGLESGILPTIQHETNHEVNDCHLGEYGHQFMADFIYNEIIGKIQ